MQCDYQPVIVVTGWEEPLPGQRWIKLRRPSLGLRSLAGFLINSAAESPGSLGE